MEKAKIKLLNWIKSNKWLVIILLVAGFLRFYNLLYQSTWVDELHTMIEANPSISFKESNDLILFREGTPRLYFFIVKIFSSIFGHTVFNARLISVFFGLLSVVVINKLGNKLFNKNVGLYSAVLLTFNLFLIEYSQEARTYSMLVFFVILAFYCLILFIKNRTYKNSILLGISLGLVTNAHPIGLLNVVSVYIVLLYILLIEKESKIDLLKKSFVAGIICIVLFIPTIPTIAAVLNFKSFWIIKPNLAYLFQIFNQLLGSSLVFTYVFILIYFVFVYKSIQVISKKTSQQRNSFIIGFIIINVWIWFEVIVILLKSYFGISIVLHRYFIAIVPAFILIIAVTIDFIKNNLLKQFVLFVLIAYLTVDIFLIKDFYSVDRKSQFDKVANYIVEKNTSKNKIVSSWGWLMGYYFNESNGLSAEEKPLNNYVDDMRKGITNPSSFWYVDGNSNKFDLSEENKVYINQNFITKNRLEAFDAWCVEFKSKHNENAFIELKKFEPSIFDGSGAMIFIENGTSKYPKINLEKGEYILAIKGFSLPEKPINNENAHFNILVNKNIIKSVYISNIQNQEPLQISIVHNGGDFILELVYDNDVVVGSQDRNAVINAISLKIKK
jgi:uncharacterized membrane protein